MFGKNVEMWKLGDVEINSKYSLPQRRGGAGGLRLRVSAVKKR